MAKDRLEIGRVYMGSELPDMLSCPLFGVFIQFDRALAKANMVDRVVIKKEGERWVLVAYGPKEVSDG